MSSGKVTHDRDLSIVDNSISGWIGRRYLNEWAEIARAFDMATGHFEIGSFLLIDRKLQTPGSES